MSSYTRDTELRHLHHKDIYDLSLILDDNEGWLDLIQVIPKKIDNQNFNIEESTDCEEFLPFNERKYNNDHIRLIQDAVQYHGHKLFSEILFDEWGTSGRKHERPTLGVLLKLLLKAKLIRAANFLAKNLLKEPLPQSTAEAAAKIVDTSLPSEIFKDIEDMVFDSEFYPSTEILNKNDESLMDNNKDFYTKYINGKQILTNDSSGPPKPPPRLLKSLRLQNQQQNSIKISRITNNEENGNSSNVATQNAENALLLSNQRNGKTDCNTMPTTSTSTVNSNLPLLSILVKPRDKSNDEPNVLNIGTVETNTSRQSKLDSNLPLLSIFEKHLKPKKEEDMERKIPTQQNLLNNIDNVEIAAQESEKNVPCLSILRNNQTPEVDKEYTLSTSSTRIQLKNSPVFESNFPLLSIFEKRKNVSNDNPMGYPAQQQRDVRNESPMEYPIKQDIPNINSGELLHENGVIETERNVPSLSTPRNTEHKHEFNSQLQMTNDSILDSNLPLLSILTKPSKRRPEERIDNYNEEVLPSLSVLDLNGACNASTTGNSSNNADCNKVVEDHSIGSNSEFPQMATNNNENSSQVLAIKDDFNMNKNNACNTNDMEGDDEDDDDDNSLPNLSIFDQASSNNDSSLTNVTGTSGENSFDLSLNDCSSASMDNIPSLGALKQ
uniref:Death_2 domain-containing protein n=1 Tax=Glossina brevipalpis TaxID=37001 RepID=A0A1A9W5R0_9MUSC